MFLKFGEGLQNLGRWLQHELKEDNDVVEHEGVTPTKWIRRQEHEPKEKA